MLSPRQQNCHKLGPRQQRRVKTAVLSQGDMDPVYRGDTKSLGEKNNNMGIFRLGDVSDSRVNPKKSSRTTTAGLNVAGAVRKFSRRERF